MTCIVGLEHKGKVYMGADSAAVNDHLYSMSNPKLFRLGPFLIGFTSSWRMGQLIQHQLGDVAIQTTKDDLDYLVSHFIEPVRACLKDYGCAKIENNEETGGTFIVAYKQKVYTVWSDFSILRNVSGIACIGAGREFAYGAMTALVDMPSKKRIHKALTITASMSPWVGPPFHIKRL